MDRTKKQCLQRCGSSCNSAALPDKVAYPALHMALAQPWARSASRRLHLPISNDRDVVAGRAVHFDAVIPDDSYLKPLEHLHQAHLKPQPATPRPASICHNSPGGAPLLLLSLSTPGGFPRAVHLTRHGCVSPAGRDPVLLYIARLTRGKGQEQFLQAAPPSALRGLTVAFYAGKRDEEAVALAARLHALAENRNISIEVHLDRVDRGELHRRACRASGMVLFPRCAAAALSTSPMRPLIH